MREILQLEIHAQFVKKTNKQERYHPESKCWFVKKFLV